MKNAIFALALAAVAVSCTQSSEETAVETNVDTTLVVEDTTVTDVVVEGEEASAE
jgi:hypothetical protein